MGEGELTVQEEKNADRRVNNESWKLDCIKGIQVNFNLNCNLINLTYYLNFINFSLINV